MYGRIWTSIELTMQRRKEQPTPVLLPGKSHGWRSLVGCSPWGRKGSDTTEWLLSRFSLSCIGEGNGNPLQCSCLENPRDEGAWWAAVYGVAQSRTGLKWLSSSSSRRANHDQQRKSSEENAGMCGVIWSVKWEFLMDSLIDWFFEKLSRILICGVYSLMICHSCWNLFRQ